MADPSGAGRPEFGGSDSPFPPPGNGTDVRGDTFVTFSPFNPTTFTPFNPFPNIPDIPFNPFDPCSILPPNLQAACRGLVPGPGPQQPPPGPSGPTAVCPPGTVRQNGGCVTVGSPGGGGGGTVVMGSFGIPATTPVVVGNIRGKPIRQCNKGSVLGMDELCYMKGSLPTKFRKWKPAPKPPMSAADAKSLRRIGTLQKRVKKLAGDANLSCKRK